MTQNEAAAPADDLPEHPPIEDRLDAIEFLINFATSDDRAPLVQTVEALALVLADADGDEGVVEQATEQLFAAVRGDYAYDLPRVLEILAELDVVNDEELAELGIEV